MLVLDASLRRLCGKPVEMLPDDSVPVVVIGVDAVQACTVPEGPDLIAQPDAARAGPAEVGDIAHRLAGKATGPAPLVVAALS
ncbi:MAG: hypothetical protein M3471_05685, partial [Actinomycetota bacterium]|nr:hypothetical protein [Actinomycetota bacterium]